MGNQKFVITINREAGSGGKEIATKLGELLGVKVYGKEILASILEKYNLTNEDAEKIMRVIEAFDGVPIAMSAIAVP